jgi:hypothetical protein
MSEESSRSTRRPRTVATDDGVLHPVRLPRGRGRRARPSRSATRASSEMRSPLHRVDEARSRSATTSARLPRCAPAQTRRTRRTEREALLGFVLVGGGTRPASELAGDARGDCDAQRGAARDFAGPGSVDARRACSSGRDRLLAAFPESAHAPRARDRVARARRSTCASRTMVESVDAGGVVLASGERIRERRDGACGRRASAGAAPRRDGSGRGARPRRSPQCRSSRPLALAGRPELFCDRRLRAACAATSGCRRSPQVAIPAGPSGRARHTCSARCSSGEARRCAVRATATRGTMATIGRDALSRLAALFGVPRSSRAASRGSAPGWSRTSSSWPASATVSSSS